MPPPIALRFMAPPETHLCWDEALDLHGAVAGQNLGVRQFVEDFVGEAISSGLDPAIWPKRPIRYRADTNRSVPRTADSRMSDRRELLDRRSAAATPSRHTGAMRRALEALVRIDKTLETAQRLTGSNQVGSGGQAKFARTRAQTLKQIIKLEDQVAIHIAELLVDLDAHVRWKRIGFSGLAEYAAERVGWSASETYRRVRLSRHLRPLAALRGAYENGRVGVEAATWVVRNVLNDATQGKAPETKQQRNWTRHAATVTIKRLRDEDRLLRRQQLLRRSAVAQQITVEHARQRSRGSATELHTPTVTAQRPAQASEVNRKSSAAGIRCGPPITAVAKRFRVVKWSTLSAEGLAGIPSDADWRSFVGRTPGQGRDQALALGSKLVERVALRGAVADLPMKLVLPEDLAQTFWGCIESARRSLSERAPFLCRQPAPSDARLSPAERIARDLCARDQRLPHWLGLQWLLEQFMQTWDDPNTMSRRPLDAIHSRDGWRCTAPGCTARRNLQIHHLKHRAQGGGNEVWNLQEVCAFHHLQGEHGDFARVRGRAPLNVVWRLGTADLGTWYRNERRISPAD